MGSSAPHNSRNLFRSAAGLVLRGERKERLLEELAYLRFTLFPDRFKAHRANLSVGIGFEYSKRRILRKIWPERDFHFVPMRGSLEALRRLTESNIDFEPWVWSYRDQDYGFPSDFWGRRQVTRVEDGFVRSIGLGTRGAPPHSFCVDRRGLYFDANRESDLENILSEWDFRSDARIMEHAATMIEKIKLSQLTKYIMDKKRPLDKEKTSTEILVLGQVEGDKSIIMNECALQTNEELISQAIKDNPGGNIVYRPHPDVTIGSRVSISHPERLLPKFGWEPPNRSLAQALDAAKTVYTISSLAGFEALMRGCKVKTFGAPFYAGWGLTEDAVAFPRRRRQLTLNELFAGAYVLYPIYFDPRSGTRLDLSETICRLEALASTRYR